MTVLWTLTPEQTRRIPFGGYWHGALCTWACNNGLDPDNIVAAHPVTVEEVDGERVIRYRRFLRNEAGRIRIDVKRDMPESVEETMPLLVDPPQLPAETT
jgi:hypothetical protein